MHAEYAEGPVLSDLAGLARSGTVRGFALHLVDSRVPLAPAVGPRGHGGLAGDQCSRRVLRRHRRQRAPLSTRGRRPRVRDGADRCRAALLWLGWRDASSTVLKQLDPPHLESPRTKIARVWLAANYRHQGIAIDMLRAIASHGGIDILDFGWELPFTDAGGALARPICPDAVLGSAGDGFMVAIALGRL